MLVLYCPMSSWGGREVEPNVIAIVAGDPYGLSVNGEPYVDYGQVTPGDQAWVLLNTTTGNIMLERMV